MQAIRVLLRRSAAQGTTRRCFSADTKKKFPMSGASYMGGIRSFREPIEKTWWKPEKEITIAHAKEQGFMFNKPVRQYVNHHKHGRSHLLVNLEFDYLHCWARPPVPKELKHSTVLDEHAKMHIKDFVPAMQRDCEFEDDWILTDFKSLYMFTPAWVPVAFEQFLGTALYQEGSEEFQAMLDQHVQMLGGEDVDMDEGSYVHSTSHKVSKDHQKTTVDLKSIGHPRSAIEEYEKDSISAILGRNALPKEGEDKVHYMKQSTDFGTSTQYTGYNRKKQGSWHGPARDRSKKNSKREQEQQD